MDKLKFFVAWLVTLLLFTLYLLSVWNCGGEFAITVQVDSLKVTKRAGLASRVTGSIKVSGEGCDYSERFEGTVDSTGTLIITKNVCGQRMSDTIRGLRPGSTFKRELKLSKGGMMVLQVPLSFANFGTWKVRSLVTGDTASVVFSDTPFGYTPLHPFMPESGKKIVYARWRTGFKDSVVFGELVGNFETTFRGIDTIKYILGGLMEFRGGAVGVDSNYIFAEFPPGGYSFAGLHPLFTIPIHLIFGEWIVLTDAQATSLTLPNVATSRYTALFLEGGTAAQVDTTYTLFSGTSKRTGVFAGTKSIGGRLALIARFLRSDFYAVVDSTRARQEVSLGGKLISVPYSEMFEFPVTFAFGFITAVVERIAGVTPGQFELFQNYPNPFNITTTIEYTIPREAQVTLKVYDILGREVATLVDEQQTAGKYKIRFNAGELASEVYLYELKAEDYRETRKMLLVK